MEVDAGGLPKRRRARASSSEIATAVVDAATMVLAPGPAAPNSALAPVKPVFPPAAASAAAGNVAGPSGTGVSAGSSGTGAGAEEARGEVRSVRVPAHRLTPLKEQWEALIAPLVSHMALLVRMNVKTRCVELKASPATRDAGALQKGEDFVRAFMLGFDLADAVALLRLDDLYIETFEVTDVKPLKGDHLGRAVGRIAGVGGKTRFAIENATRTRIVVADVKVHILGAFANIQIARDAVCSLILGTPPGKVYNSMRAVASRIASKH